MTKLYIDGRTTGGSVKQSTLNRKRFKSMKSYYLSMDAKTIATLAIAEENDPEATGRTWVYRNGTVRSRAKVYLGTAPSYS